MPTSPPGNPRNAIGARRLWLLTALAVLAFAALAVDVPPALAQEQTETIFVGRASSEPVTQPRSDGNVTIQGRIVDRSGRPVPGVQVRISWNGGSMTTVSNVSGSFIATIGTGPYQAELTNLPSRAVSFTVDTETTARLEFVETQVAGTPAPVGATAVAASTTAAATPAASATNLADTPTPVRSSPTPNAATRTAQAATPTPTPVLTPVPDIGTPIPLIGAAPTARPQVTPTIVPVIRRAFEFEPNIEPWLSAFLYGVGISTAAAVFYLVIVAIRR